MRAELPVSLGNLIRTAVSVLRGVSVAPVSVTIRLRLISMLERERSGYCDHPLLGERLTLLLLAHRA